MLAGLLLVLCAGLLVPATALAQTALVSNTGQTFSVGDASTVGTSGSSKWTQAQQFTTGSNSGGYTLASVQLYVRDFGGSDAVRVSLYSDSSGSPGSSLHVLTNPASVTNNSLNTFTAPANTTLAKDTKYFVVVEATAGSFGVGRTNSDSEDAGGASGWVIGDNRQVRSSDTGSWTTVTASMRMSVNGSVIVPNTAATGTPVITGGNSPGDTVTAGRGTIADADGLPTTTFPDGYNFQCEPPVRTVCA